jgi:phage shock protein A
MPKQGIIGRVMQLARANVNAMIDSAEDPQKMLDQLVRDYSANILGGHPAGRPRGRNLRGRCR